MYQDLLIHPEDLHAALTHGDVVVLDCRFALSDPSEGRRRYQQDHVVGARFVDLDEDLSGPKRPHGGRHPLPDLDRFGATLRALGVNHATRVIAYDDARFAFAARLWWLLRYLGHTRVQVLNGGYAGWRAAGLPVSSGTSQAHPGSPGDFVGAPNASMLVERSTLLMERDRARLPLIDAREGKRFRGEEEPIDPVAGHIPGAVCYPWQAFTDAAGWAIPEADNRARWASLEPDAQPVVYCGSGVTACVNILSLHAAGVPGARLYAGSWSDWCSYPDAPIAIGD